MKINGPLSLIFRWFFLSATGIWVYITGKSLQTTTALGTPFYDWQWYIPATAVVTISLLRLAYPAFFTRFRYTKQIFVILVIWLLIGFTGFGQKEFLSLQDMPPITLSFWGPGNAEPLSETLLADLQTAGATLYLPVPLPLEDENRTNLSHFLRQLAGYDIPVVLFVPASDFLSAPVYQKWISNSEQVVAFLEDDKPKNVRGLIGDAEGPHFTSFASFSASRLSVSKANQGLKQFIQTSQQANPELPIGVTASWPLYLDNLDGDNDLALLYQSSVDPPGNWGFISIMNYSSYYPQSWRAYLVARTIWSMERRFPDSSPIHLIGLAGKGFAWEPVLDFAGVVKDARIGRALGVEEVVIFHLKGAIDIHGQDFVARLNTAVNGPHSENTVTIPFSRPASLWLFGYAVVDAALDLWLGQVWLTLGWLGACFCLLWWSERHH